MPIAADQPSRKMLLNLLASDNIVSTASGVLNGVFSGNDVGRHYFFVAPAQVINQLNHGGWTY